MTDSAQRNRGLERRAQKIADKLDDIAEMQEDVKTLKAQYKEEGYNLKALNQVVKEKRRGAQYQADQQELEAEVQTYRRACDLPTTLEDAQKRAKEAADQAPNADGERAAREKRRVNEPLN